jgi:hypothetical protein
MALAIWPLQERLPAAVELALQVGIGAIVYGGVILACDVARSRTLLGLWWASRRARRP